MNFANNSATAPGSMAFGDMVVACLSQLRSQACGLTGHRDSADDLIQDTLVRAFAAEKQFAPGTNLRGWLYTILRNVHRSNYRRRRFDIDSLDDVNEAHLARRPQQLVHLELRETLGFLQGVSADRRESLLMICAAGMSYEEVAAASGCAVGTAKSRVNRARSHVRQRVSKSLTACESPEIPRKLRADRAATPRVAIFARSHQRLAGWPVSAAA